MCVCLCVCVCVRACELRHATALEVPQATAVHAQCTNTKPNESALLTQTQATFGDALGPEEYVDGHVPHDFVVICLKAL